MLAFFVLSILIVGIHGQVRLELQQRRNNANDVRKFYAEFYDQLRTRGLMLSNNYPRDLLTVEIEVGQPAKTFNLALGLDSPMMWILDNAYANLSSTQHGYKANESSTSKLVERNEFSLEAPHKLNGDLYSDQIRFNVDSSLTQEFGVVHTIQRVDGIPFRDADGVFGLGWKENNSDQSSISQLMAHVNVSRRMLTLNGRNGSLLLGALDKERCHSDVKLVPLTFHPINNLLTFKVDPFKSGSFEMNGENAFLDIGFTFVQMPGGAYQAVYDQSNLDYNWELNLLTVSCDNHDLNNWIFVIGGREFALESTDFVIDIGIGNNTCAFALDYNFDPYNIQFVIGNPFLQAYCTVVDVDQNLIGFSKSLD